MTCSHMSWISDPDDKGNLGFRSMICARWLPTQACSTPCAVGRRSKSSRLLAVQRKLDREQRERVAVVSWWGDLVVQQGTTPDRSAELLYERHIETPPPHVRPGYPPRGQRSGRSDLGGGTWTPLQLGALRLAGGARPPPSSTVDRGLREKPSARETCVDFSDFGIETVRAPPQRATETTVT